MERIDKNVSRCLEIATPRFYSNMDVNRKKIRSLREKGLATQAIKTVDKFVVSTDQTTEEGYCARFALLGYLDEFERKTMNREQQNKFVKEMAILNNEYFTKELPTKDELAMQVFKQQLRIWLK